MNYFTNLSPLLIPIIALIIPIVAIISKTVLKVTRLNLLHETVRHLTQHGQPIPPELLSQIVDSQSS